MSVPDRIEKEVVLKAPLARVWQAISDSQQFGAWFGARFEQPFVAGTTVNGTIQPTTVDPEVAKQQAPYVGKPLVLEIERLDAPRSLAFRWHPGIPDEGEDQPKAPTTLVELELTEVEGGTRLRITESGFDGLPLARRTEIFHGNEAGWDHQTRLIGGYLDQHAA